VWSGWNVSSDRRRQEAMSWNMVGRLRHWKREQRRGAWHTLRHPKNRMGGFGCEEGVLREALNRLLGAQKRMAAADEAEPSEVAGSDGHAAC